MTLKKTHSRVVQRFAGEARYAREDCGWIKGGRGGGWMEWVDMVPPSGRAEET